MLNSFCIENSLGSGVEEGHHNLGKVGGRIRLPMVPSGGQFSLSASPDFYTMHILMLNVFQLIEQNMFPGELMFVLFSYFI